MDRETFPDDLDEIKPRPLEIPPPPKPKPPEIVPPTSPEPRPDAAQAKRAARHIFEKDGATESERLLQSIIVAARREPPNAGALRTLCVRFSREHSLDF
jgi:hypothetical protein